MAGERLGANSENSAGSTLPSASLTWSLHLARRQPRKTAAALTLIVAASVAAGYGCCSALLGALAAVLLVASISDFVLPLRFRLTDEGVEVRGLLHRRRMAWRQVRRVVQDDLGVKLSPLPKPSRLDAYRGIYVWFEGNADEVMAFIAHHARAEAAGGDDLASV